MNEIFCPLTLVLSINKREKEREVVDIEDCNYRQQIGEKIGPDNKAC